MSDQELREINGRVADALGWGWYSVRFLGEPENMERDRDGYFEFLSPENAESRRKDTYNWSIAPCCEPNGYPDTWDWQVPRYCTDPAAADLVESWFESEGWRLIQDFVPVCGGGKHWFVKAFKQDGVLSAEGGSKQSRKVALCLAVLAAVETEKATAQEESASG